MISNSPLFPEQLPETYPPELEQLGKPTVVLGTAPSIRIMAVIWAVVMVGFAVLMFSQADPNRADRNPTALIIFGIMLILGAAAVLFVQLRKWGWLAFSYEGLVYMAHNEPLFSIRWEDIKDIYQDVQVTRYVGIPIRTYRDYSIYANRRTHKMGGIIAKPDQAWHFIQMEVMKRQLPPMLKKIDNGETISFAKFRLDRAGISSSGGKQIGWNNIRDVTAFNGVIYIYPKDQKWGNWDFVLVKEMPNTLTFLELTRRMRR